MGLSTITQITCDCCGYVFNSGTAAYTVVATTPVTANGINLGLASTTYLCSTHGCDAGVTGTLTSDIATLSTTHKSRIAGGVIPAH